MPHAPIALGGLLAATLLILAGYAGYLAPREAPKMQRYLLKGQAEIMDFAMGRQDRVDSGILYPGDPTPRVLLARRLNLSFTRHVPELAWHPVHSTPNEMSRARAAEVIREFIQPNRVTP